MINRIYRLTAPGWLETDYESVSLIEKQVVVRPTYLSICAADQRYYRGERSLEMMRKKLPMALIHEGIGQVLWDETHTYRQGDLVIMLPNVAAEEDLSIKENYRPGSRFLSSGYDGFLRDYVLLPPEQLLQLPEGAGIHYVFTELLSVACNAISTYQALGRGKGQRFGVWGSGSMGYTMALALRVLYPQAQITVIGRGREKLQYCSFADRLRLAAEDIPKNSFDCGFECVGGSASQQAIDQMITCVRPQGTLVLLGVSEEPVDLRTRTVLEKGLALLGASRSGREDFETALSIIQRKKRVENYLKVIISQEVEIQSVQDIRQAFYTDTALPFKTVMRWNT